MRLLLLLLVAAAIELGVFNFVPLWTRIAAGDAVDKACPLEAMQMVNWTRDGASWVSAADPQLVLNGPGIPVHSVGIRLETDPPVEKGTLYYTPLDGEGLSWLSIDNLGEKERVTRLPQAANVVRLDPGEAPGLRLYGATVTLNPTAVRFSLSRFFAMLLLAYGSAFLFALQRNPDYGITGEEGPHAP